MKAVVLKDMFGVYAEKNGIPRLFPSRNAAKRFAGPNSSWEPEEVSVTYVPGKVVHITDDPEVVDGVYRRTDEGLIVRRMPGMYVKPGGILIIE